ncbi:MAG: bile acid:sodium symporter family protein [Haliscomenobacter sp.]|nr:bile acid:sodium symporter family protein [Haliscomenobacter sp.]
MQDIDSIRINFNAEQLTLLNLCLAFIMFGVALDLQIEYFKKVFRSPRVLAVGLASQLVGLPLLTLGLIYLLRPNPSLAFGMLLVAACPGGNVSNYATHLSKANTALSVAMTTISTLGAVLLTPLVFSTLTPLLPEGEALSRQVSVDPWSMVWSIVQLILIPLAAGLVFRHYLPHLTARILGPIQKLSMVIFLGFVVFALYGNFSNIVRYLDLVFLLVAIHNGAALTMGYFWAKWNKVGEANARAIALETGIQNSGLGLVLVFNFFDGLGGMAIIAAWWGIWHLLSAFSLAMFWRRKGVERVERM